MASGAKEDIEKMRSHHSYAIGQKIPAFVKPYTLQEISSNKFAGKHSSLLRILTKWA